MTEEKLLNIIKDYFRDNFEQIEHDHKFSEPIYLINKSHGVGGMFGRINDSNMVLGTESSHSIKLRVDKFIFIISKKEEELFNIAISFENWRQGNYNHHKSPTPSSMKEEYKVSINRISNNISNYNDDFILTKEIKTDSKYFDSIIESIQYNEKRMFEELDTLLTEVRNKKIDKITK